MRSSLKWMVPGMAAVAMFIGWTALNVKAAEDKEVKKGTVTGTVVDKEGKAVEGATVNLYKPFQRRQGQGGGGAAGQAFQGQEALPLQAQGQRQRPEPVATATTDKDGKFKMEKVPVGEYMASCRVQDKGFARANVNVKADQTAEVALKLGDMPARGGGAGGGRGNRGGGAGGNQ